jgi:phosphatidylinositol-3-phosphatase
MCLSSSSGKVVGVSVPRIAALLFAFALVAAGNADLEIPRYQHIVVIIDENKDYGQILDPAHAPHISALAKAYGNATNFWAETHPSEPNYVALVGGDTFGIQDDGAYSSAGHTIDGANLATQLDAAGLTWKGYYESIPAPGSSVIFANGGLYATKHSGFMNFASVQNDPKRAEHIVGFDQLDRDIAANDVPSFALIVPNQCNDMHGVKGAQMPADCQTTDGLIRRGDAVIGELVAKLQSTQAWASSENFAIVVTFDEGSKSGRDGGHIPTVVITNHGPRGVIDDGSYTHYALLRTIEDAFGIHEYLRHAAESAPMLPLFTVRS